MVRPLPERKDPRHFPLELPFGVRLPEQDGVFCGCSFGVVCGDVRLVDGFEVLAGVGELDGVREWREHDCIGEWLLAFGIAMAAAAIALLSENASLAAASSLAAMSSFRKDRISASFRKVSITKAFDAAASSTSFSLR